MIESGSFDVVRALTPVRRGLTVARVERSALRGLGLGAAVGSLVLLLSHFQAVPHALPVSLGLVALLTLAGAVDALRRRPNLLEAARSADRHFALSDRLTTALEFRLAQDSLSSLQRADVLSRLASLDLRDSARPRFNRREVAAVMTCIVALLVLALLGTAAPRTQPVQSAGDEPRIQRASARLPAISRSLESGLTPYERRDPGLRRLQLALTHLQRELMRTSSPATALRAVSSTQQQLQRISASFHPIDRRAAAQLAASLNEAGTQAKRPSAGNAAQQSASAADALQKLATRLRRLTPAQRAALRRSLQRASSASSDRALRAAMDRAASSLERGGLQSGSRSLQAAAAALQSAAAQAAAQSAANAANGRLDSLKNEISGLSQSPGSQLPSTSSESPPGRIPEGSSGRESKGALLQSRQGGSGAQQAGRSGSSGRNVGSGATTGGGQQAGQSAGRGRLGGAGSGPGQGSPGGRASGGGHGDAGPRGQGKYTTVYVPYVRRNGPRASQAAPEGTQQRRFVPYSTVIAQYKRSERIALDRGSLPPALQSYVRRYFTAISR